jgi:hypothetical protein
MITIKTIDDNNAKINIPKGTKHTTILLGIEMLIEALMEQSSANLTIDDLLEDLKRIYLRDNGGNNEK